MGNLCGCVRAEKERYLDPAKTPLSPEKYSSGRRYFQRKPVKKSVGDTEVVEPNSQNKGKKNGVQLSEDEPNLLSRRLVRVESVTPNLRLEDGIQQEDTEFRDDSVTPTPLLRTTCPVNFSPARDSDTGVKVSELNERILVTDNTPCCAKKNKYLDDVNIRQKTFQRKTDVFSCRKAFSLISVHCDKESSFEKSRISQDLSKSHSNVQEKQLSDSSGFPAVYHFHFEEKGCHSLSINVSTATKDTDENEVSEMWSWK